MDAKIFLPALFFTMKYFFDVEKEVAQQVLSTVQYKLHCCKKLLVTTEM